MYKSIGRKLYKNSLSSILISKELFVSKLKNVNLFLKVADYREYGYVDGDISILKEKTRGRVIDKLVETLILKRVLSLKVLFTVLREVCQIQL